MSPTATLLSAALVLLLSACTPAAHAPAASTPTAGGGECNAGPIQSLVGQEASNELTERAMRDSGSSSVRVIAPGQAVTMDFRHDRLNLYTDAANLITRISCG